MQDLSEHSNVLSLLQVVQDLEHHSKKSHHGTHHGQDLDDHKMKSHHASYQHHLPEGLSIRSEPTEQASLIGTLNK